MSVRQFLERRFWVAYVLWILLCVVLFFGLRGAEDPSRGGDRLDGIAAGKIALQQLRASDPARYSSYEVAHVTFARDDELGDSSRWLVLCDAPERSGLTRAIVVEVDPATAKVIRYRRPAS